MQIIYINFAATYYPDIAKTEVPEHYAGKFVQILNGPIEYLIFSPREFTRYHADIVERFCIDRKIPGIYNSRDKIFDIIDHHWAISGGGKFEMDRIRNRLRLYDDSLAYGKFVRTGLMEKILSIPDFSDYRIKIE